MPKSKKQIGSSGSKGPDPTAERAPGQRPSRPSTTQPSSSSPRVDLFISAKAKDLFSTFYQRKKIISGRKVVFPAFGEFQLEHRFHSLSLVPLMSLDELIFPKMVYHFYTNLRISANSFSSRVNGKDFTMTFQEFATFLQCPFSGAKIYSETSHTFKWPEGHSLDSFIATLFPPGTQNPHTEQIKEFTEVGQIVARIIVHNLIPKSGEFDTARGCVPLLTYAILTGMSVNIPRLIISQLSAVSSAPPNRSLPFGMLICSLLSYIHIPHAGCATFPQAPPFDAGYLSRKRSHQHPPLVGAAPTVAPVPPTDLGASSSSVRPPFDTASEDYRHHCATLRFLQESLMGIMDKLQVDYPPETVECHPMSYTGPPFAPWEPRSTQHEPLADSDDEGDQGEQQTASQAGGSGEGTTADMDV